MSSSDLEEGELRRSTPRSPSPSRPITVSAECMSPDARGRHISPSLFAGCLEARTSAPPPSCRSRTQRSPLALPDDSYHHHASASRRFAFVLTPPLSDSHDASQPQTHRASPASTPLQRVDRHMRARTKTPPQQSWYPAPPNDDNSRYVADSSEWECWPDGYQRRDDLSWYSAGCPAVTTCTTPRKSPQELIEMNSHFDARREDWWARRRRTVREQDLHAAKTSTHVVEATSRRESTCMESVRLESLEHDVVWLLQKRLDRLERDLAEARQGAAKSTDSSARLDRPRTQSHCSNFKPSESARQDTYRHRRHRRPVFPSNAHHTGSSSRSISRRPDTQACEDERLIKRRRQDVSRARRRSDDEWREECSPARPLHHSRSTKAERHGDRRRSSPQHRYDWASASLRTPISHCEGRDSCRDTTDRRQDESQRRRSSRRPRRDDEESYNHYKHSEAGPRRKHHKQRDRQGQREGRREETQVKAETLCARVERDRSIDEEGCRRLRHDDVLRTGSRCPSAPQHDNDRHDRLEGWKRLDTTHNAIDKERRPQHPPSQPPTFSATAGSTERADRDLSQLNFLRHAALSTLKRKRHDSAEAGVRRESRGSAWSDATPSLISHTSASASTTTSATSAATRPATGVASPHDGPDNSVLARAVLPPRPSSPLLRFAPPLVLPITTVAGVTPCTTATMSAWFPAPWAPCCFSSRGPVAPSPLLAAAADYEVPCIIEDIDSGDDDEDEDANADCTAPLKRRLHLSVAEELTDIRARQEQQQMTADPATTMSRPNSATHYTSLEAQIALMKSQIQERENAKRPATAANAAHGRVSVNGSHERRPLTLDCPLVSRRLRRTTSDLERLFASPVPRATA